MYRPSFRFILLIFTILAIFIALPLYGQTPTPPKISNEPKAQTENKKGDTKTNQPISKNFSISGTFKNTPQGNMEPSYPANHHDNKATDDKAIQNCLIITFTGVIAFAAVLQFIALLYQAHWMKRQSKEIEKSLAITKETADAAKIQAEITEKEYVLKNRAKIRVRDVIITNLGDPFLAKESPEGELEIVNVGGTPADIINIGSWFEIGYGKELPTERPDKTEPPNLPNPQPTRFGSGQSHAYPFVDNRNTMSSDAWDHIRRPRGQCALYAIGYVEYIDITDTTKNTRSENTRRTTFFRKYRLDKGMVGGHKEDRRFFPLEGYEYEE
jgi:hypothetical protein